MKDFYFSFFLCSDLAGRVGGRGRGRVDDVPALGDGPPRPQSHQQAQEAEAEGEGLQEGGRRSEGEECDGGLQSQGERSEENDEMKTIGDGSRYFYFSKYNLNYKKLLSDFDSRSRTEGRIADLRSGKFPPLRGENVPGILIAILRSLSN